ncbi:MAG: glucoamylase family protein [Terriglobia bacterium]
MTFLSFRVVSFRLGNYRPGRLVLYITLAVLLQPCTPAYPRGITGKDRFFLQNLSYRCFLFFWEQADAHTGLVPDRSLVVGLPETGARRDVANVAGTGFGLTAVCIGAEHHWITKAQARQRILTTLEFLAYRAPEIHGWYYHWMDKTNGHRILSSEISSIDTSLLLAGVLTTMQAFPRDREIGRLALLIYDRVDFQWMLNGSPNLLSHGWRPERGFLADRWDSYSELMLLYLLAIGSPTHPIPPSSWYAWRRPLVHFEGYTFVGDLPLFTQQYAQAWVDFRGRRDAPPSNIDYFQNSFIATEANRAFCISLSHAFPKSYSENVWGLTASDSANGYMVWGAPTNTSIIDGTVVPCAPGGSLMFAPHICLTALETMVARFGSRIYKRYGFADAFNPTTGWVDNDVIAIDTGITLLSAENLLDQGVWRWFMRNESIQRAMKLARLRPEHTFQGALRR